MMEIICSNCRPVTVKCFWNCVLPISIFFLQMMRMCFCVENARNNLILCLPSWHTSANSANQVRHHCQRCPWHQPLHTHLFHPSVLDLRLLPIDRYWKLWLLYQTTNGLKRLMLLCSSFLIHTTNVWRKLINVQLIEKKSKIKCH